MISMSKIRAFSRRVARDFRPERVILFGSYANGEPMQDSDVDLLIVLPHNGRAVDKSVEIRLKARPGFPCDLLVRTPRQVAERLRMGDPFMQAILEQGRALYEADHT